MTTQEAAKLIKELYYEEDYCLVPKLSEALDLSIMALEDNSRLSHDNFKLKKEIAELNRTIEEVTQITTDWRIVAVKNWVDSEEEKACSGCIHYNKEEWELPCVRCSRGNKDYWKAGDVERG